VFQIQLAKRTGAVPFTRDYLYVPANRSKPGFDIRHGVKWGLGISWSKLLEWELASLSREGSIMPTGLDVFDATVQQTNLWLKDLMARVPTTDRHYAYQLLRATLHTFRDRIGPENAVHFGAQLPMLIRGFYYEGWQPSKSATKTRHLDDFLTAVEEEAGRTLGAGAGGKVKAVFSVIADKIDAHEIEKLRKVLPAELKGLLLEEFYLF
jgi:uncharacterized protein (DUF2267 family)